MNNATTNSKTVTLAYVDGTLVVEVVGAEHDGYLVRELGTSRCDWFQRDRVRIYWRG